MNTERGNNANLKYFALLCGVIESFFLKLITM
jgi:hypothetical protein